MQWLRDSFQIMYASETDLMAVSAFITTVYFVPLSPARCAILGCRLSRIYLGFPETQAPAKLQRLHLKVYFQTRDLIEAMREDGTNQRGQF